MHIVFMHLMLAVIIQKKNQSLSQTQRQKTKQQNQTSVFLQFAAEVLFLLDNNLKEEKCLYSEAISEHNKSFSTQGCCHAHKNIFMDKLMNILQKVSHEKAQISYSR